MVESDSLPEMVHVGDNSEITMEGAPASHQLPQAAGGEVSAAAAAPVTNASGRSLARRDTSSSQHSHSGLAKLAIRHEVLHSLQEAVVVVGRDEKVELYNEAAFELWGYPEDTIVGAHYSVLFGRDVDMSPHNKSQSRILTKNKVCMPIGYRTPFMLGQLHIQACEIPKLIKTYAYHAGLVRNSETTAKVTVAQQFDIDTRRMHAFWYAYGLSSECLHVCCFRMETSCFCASPTATFKLSMPKDVHQLPAG